MGRQPSHFPASPLEHEAFSSSWRGVGSPSTCCTILSIRTPAVPSIVAAQPFAFLTVRDGFGVAPNSAPIRCVSALRRLILGGVG